MLRAIVFFSLETALCLRDTLCKKPQSLPRPPVDKTLTNITLLLPWFLLQRGQVTLSNSPILFQHLLMNQVRRIIKLGFKRKKNIKTFYFTSWPRPLNHQSQFLSQYLYN